MGGGGGRGYEERMFVYVYLNYKKCCTDGFLVAPE